MAIKIRKQKCFAEIRVDSLMPAYPLLHSEQPKFHRVLGILSAIGLKLSHMLFLKQVLLNVTEYHSFLLPYFSGYKTEFFLPKQSERSRSILQDGSRSLGLFRKGKIGIIAKFHRTDLVI